MRRLSRSRVALASTGLLLAANVIIPLVWGDVYPFTSAPMFRDSPRQCCNYQVYAADGRLLPSEDLLLHRIYDGNPLGYGVGVCPPPILEQEFGLVSDEAAVRQHVERQFQLPQNRGHESATVIQEIIGPVDSQHVGVLRKTTWQIARP